MVGKVSKAKVIVKEKPVWYKKLIEDLRNIIEKERTTIIRLKHKIGKRILAERERVKLEFGEITKFMKDLGYEVGYSWQELYACMKFAEKYPNIESFLMDQKITWERIVHEFLYEKREERLQKFTKCGLCEHKVETRDTVRVVLCTMCWANLICDREAEKLDWIKRE